MHFQPAKHNACFPSVCRKRWNILLRTFLVESRAGCMLVDGSWLLPFVARQWRALLLCRQKVTVRSKLPELCKILLDRTHSSRRASWSSEKVNYCMAEWTLHAGLKGGVQHSDIFNHPQANCRRAKTGCVHIPSHVGPGL